MTFHSSVSPTWLPVLHLKPTLHPSTVLPWSYLMNLLSPLESTISSHGLVCLKKCFRGHGTNIDLTQMWSWHVWGWGSDCWAAVRKVLSLYIVRNMYISGCWEYINLTILPCSRGMQACTYVWGGMVGHAANTIEISSNLRKIRSVYISLCCQSEKYQTCECCECCVSCLG